MAGSPKKTPRGFLGKFPRFVFLLPGGGSSRTSLRTTSDSRCIEGTSSSLVACRIGDSERKSFSAPLYMVKIGDSSPFPSYRIDCEGCRSREDLFDYSREQLGMSLQEFCAALSQIPNAHLFFDNVMTDVEAHSVGPRYSMQLEEITEVILDYCPEAKVVLIGRTSPKRPRFKCVELRPLDEADTVRISTHTRKEGLSLLTIELSSSYRRSEGIPIHVDRFLRVLKVLSLNELLGRPARRRRSAGRPRSRPRCRRDGRRSTSRRRAPSRPRRGRRPSARRPGSSATSTPSRARTSRPISLSGSCTRAGMPIRSR